VRIPKVQERAVEQGSLASPPPNYNKSIFKGHTSPNPQSQSLSRNYGSILPTSLAHIILWTRGC